MKYDKLRNVLLGLVAVLAIALGILGLGGCNSSCNVNKASKFAQEIPKRDPNTFEKMRSKHSMIYHDKSLIIDNKIPFFFSRVLPAGGKGILMVIEDDGGLSVAEYDFDKLEKFIAGETKLSETNTKGFGYFINDDNFEEKISLCYGNSMVFYVKSEGKWEKRCYDLSKFDPEMEYESFESFPLHSKKNVNEKEVLPFFKLVKDIREKYPID